MRFGELERLRKGLHTFDNVYGEMLLQISRDYSSLPDVRTLKAREILYFYSGIIPELKAHTRPKG